jgi:virginiamycin B lyase
MRDNKLQVLLFVSLLLVTGCGATTSTPPSTKSPSVGIFTEFIIPTPDSNATVIAAGPDGNLWFTEYNKIGRITPQGAITEFPIPTRESFAMFITAGPDGNLWFTEYVGKIGRITPRGTIAEFPVPHISRCTLTAPCYIDSITTGSDGNLWFTERGWNRIGRITSGVHH